jgi:hypothetical protein
MARLSFGCARAASVIGLTAILGLHSPASAQDITAAEVASRCAEAMGGEEGADGIRSLRFLLRRTDSARNIYWEIERPNKVRKERPGQLVLVFDGERAGFLEGPPREDGTLEGPHLVSEEDWHHFEMDIALFIPAFFDYTPEYLGRETTQGRPAHVLRVVLPMGGEALYWVDAETFLPHKVTLPDWGLEQFLGDWEEVDGITYFRSYWNSPDQSDLTRLDELRINEALPLDRFALPPDIRNRGG